MPGLTIDRYNSVLVSQITCFGLEKNKAVLYQALLHVLREEGIEAIYERNDVKSREKKDFLYIKASIMVKLIPYR